MAPCGYAFGGFRLDIARRELWAGQITVAVQPKVFDCLVYLVEHRDRAVGRDELISAVWGKADVTDNVLGQIVARARHAVGDNGDEQRVIRTVVRFGYLWVAPADEIEEASEPYADAAARPRPDGGDGPRLEAARAEAPGTGDDLRAASGESPRADDELRTETIERLDPPRLEDAGASDGSSDEGAHAMGRAQGAVPARWPGGRARGVRVALGPWAALAALALMVGGVVVWSARRWWAEAVVARDPSQARSAIVLPVIVEAASSHAWVRLGVMDFVAERLRDAGQEVAPSDSVVALARGFAGASPSQREIDEIATQVGAALVVEARAELDHGVWRLSLRTRHGPESQLALVAEDGDVLAAARAATDQLAAALGLSLPPDEGLSSGERAAVALVQRVRAAILANQLDDARAVLDGAAAELQARTEVRMQRGLIELSAGRYEVACVGLEALLEAVPARGDPIRRADVLYGIGVGLLRQSKLEAAEHRLSEAVALLDGRSERGARSVLGRARMMRGASRVLRNQLAGVAEDFARARTELEGAGDWLGLGSLDNNAGQLMAEQGRIADALPFYERAAERARAMHSVVNELRARINVANTLLGMLDPAGALAHDARIVALVREVADPRLRQFTNLTRVQILAAAGRMSVAREVMREARENAARITDASVRAFTYAVAAELAADPETASRDAREGVSTATISTYSRAWLTLVRTQLARGEAAEAAATARAAADRAEVVRTPLLRMYAALARAEVAAAGGAAAEAQQAFEAAMVEADATGAPANVLEVASAHGRYLLHVGDRSRAEAVIGRVAAWATRDFDSAVLEVRLYHAAGDVTAWRSALARARVLAGERAIPEELIAAPATKTL